MFKNSRHNVRDISNEEVLEKEPKHIDEKILRDIENQLEEWSEFLNIGVGLVSFNFAIACSGSQHPVVFSILSFVIVLSIFDKGKKYFPQKIHELRKEQLKGIDELIWLGFEKKYFGFKNLFSTTNIFLIGIVSLPIVMLSSMFPNFIN